MKQSPFRLDAAIAAWRSTLQYHRSIRADDLDELERHVRDQVAHLVTKGCSEEEAFEAAMKDMGRQAETRDAYRQVYWGKLKKRRQLTDELNWTLSMLKNYAKVAWRNLVNQKGYTLIHILGLVMGLTSFILLGLFVRFELSYDRFHENADRIYRIVWERPNVNYRGNTHVAVTPAPLVETLMDEFPEVTYAAQFTRAHTLIEHNSQSFHENGIYATEYFFDVFSFDVLHGHPRTALSAPNTIILTETLARKYFRDRNPLGETLTVYTLSSENENDRMEVTVAGVVEDVPPNSHFSFDFLMPVSASKELTQGFGRWDSNSYLTYASLRQRSSFAAFSDRLAGLAPKYLEDIPYYKQYPEEVGTYSPQALTDIHLRSNLNFEFGANGDIKYIYLFSGIAFLILVIACINYINLATVRSAERSMEVGIRKAMGAQRGQLIGQFMSEALFPAALALAIALLLAFLLLPTFNELIAREMAFDILNNGAFWSLIVIAGLGSGVLAGSYPSLLMSSFHPVPMMRRMPVTKAGTSSLRNVLVIIQFTVASVLIIGAIVIQKQLHFLQSSNTGMDREQIIMIDNQDRSLYDQRFRTLKDVLERHPNVHLVTAAQTNPTDVDAASMARAWEGSKEDESVLVHRSIVQHDFVDLFGLELVEGRDFSEDIPADAREGLLINETLKNELNWDIAVGKWFDFHGRESTVIGVVKDFHFHSMHEEVAPLALFIDSGWWFPYQRIYVKVSPGDVQESIAFLRESMAEFSPGYPFEFQFLDEAYDRLYQAEVRLGSLLNAFTLIALVIACSGLLGLAAYTAQQRRKEIGVRKVLGASVPDILILLSRDFTRLVLISFAIAAPLGYFIISRWLEEFAYRIAFGWSTIVVAGLAVLLISWLTMSYQAIRAATVNPVKSIRCE